MKGRSTRPGTGTAPPNGRGGDGGWLPCRRCRAGAPASSGSKGGPRNNTATVPGASGRKTALPEGHCAGAGFWARRMLLYGRLAAALPFETVVWGGTMFLRWGPQGGERGNRSGKGVKQSFKGPLPPSGVGQEGGGARGENTQGGTSSRTLRGQVGTKIRLRILDGR